MRQAGSGRKNIITGERVPFMVNAVDSQDPVELSFNV